MAKPYVVSFVDTETTGLEVEKGHRIIEVAFSLYKTADFETYTPMGNWTQRINPLRTIDKNAEAVHGISLMDLRNSPEWSQVVPKIHRIICATDLLVAHNLAFDANFLVHQITESKLKWPKYVIGYCTMENGRSATALGKVPNLGELCWSLGVDYDPESAHAADYDTERLAQCFMRGVKYGVFHINKGLFRSRENAA